jgi:thiol-disulfide isomerase/thioredoxin
VTRAAAHAIVSALLLVSLLLSRAAAEPRPPSAADLPRFAPLEVGDPAPPVQTARWLRGPAVDRFEPGRVYVLDFWTVWCPPCVALLPHLSDLHDRFAARGVRFIAITAPDEAENSAAAVEAFLERKAGAIRVPVAYDAPAPPAACATEPNQTLCGMTALAYLKAADLDGVPIAVVVDRHARVAWIGDPAALDSVLDAIVSSSWDLVAAARRYRARRHAEPRLFQFRSLLKEGRYIEAYDIARALVRGPFAGEPGLLRTIAVSVTSLDAPQAMDLDLALTAARGAVDSSGGRDAGAWSVLARTRFLRGDWADAVAARERVVKLSEGPARLLQQRTLDEYRAAAARAAPSPQP